MLTTTCYTPSVAAFQGSIPPSSRLGASRGALAARNNPISMLQTPSHLAKQASGGLLSSSSLTAGSRASRALLPLMAAAQNSDNAMSEPAPRDTIRLDGKIALVTGGSRGIGRAIAEKLADRGATVIATATSDKGAEAISSYLSERGASGKGVKLNVQDSESFKPMLASIKEEFGGSIDILVNNAGITKDGLVFRMSEEDFRSVIDTNLVAPFLLSKACLREMPKGGGGRVINIGSVVGAMGNPGQANYCSSKGGIFGLTRSMAQEFAGRATVNAVAPGFVKSDMTDKLNEDQQQRILANIPIGRMSDPTAIANEVAYLASEEASDVTGSVRHVNGGLYMSQ